MPNRRKAVRQAIARSLLDQFSPSIFDAAFASRYQGLIDQQLAADGVAPGDANTNANNPVGAGHLAANAVLAFCTSEHANQAGLYADTTGYAPVNRPMAVVLPAAVDAIAYPGRWQSLTYLNADHDARSPDFIAPH